MPEQNTIAARRHRALMIIRIIALAMLLLGVIALCHTIGMMIVLQDISAWMYMYDDVSWTARAISLLVPGLALLMFSRSLARWLIPVPRRECHECGYSLRGLASAGTRCPECGTDVSTRPETAARK